MKTRNIVATMTTAALVGWPALALAICAAVVTAAVSINGIVVSPNLPTGPGSCKGDPGWAGVMARPFVQIGGAEPAHPTDIPQLFIAALGSAPVNKLYVGVHVPFDPDLRREDRLTLYFDANNSNTLNNGDFALVYEIGGQGPAHNTPIDAGESCDSVPIVSMYRHNGTDWGAPLAATGVTSRFAFDYDAAGDAETSLWELEIEINATTLGLTAPFRLGAKLYPHAFITDDTWQTWVWPEGLTTQANPFLYFPDDGNVTAPNMAPIELASCADVIIDEISAADQFGNPNRFYRPVNADWVPFSPGVRLLPANKRNHFAATVRFFNPSDPGDMSPVGVPNSGQVKFSIRPWGSGSGFLGEKVMAETPVSFTHLGETQNVSFTWPVHDTMYTPIANLMNVSNHSCLKVALNGFAVNLNPAADILTANLTYTTLSTRVDTFVVSARGRQSLENTQTMEFLFRTGWKNLPVNPSGWKYVITPLDTLGFKDLGKGYYSFPMQARQDRRFQVGMSGGTMPISSKLYTLDAQTGGAVLDPADGKAPLAIPVKEGQTVTIITEGRVRVWRDTLFNSANGRIDPEYRRQRFLLDASRYDPAYYIGALIGSFDGRKQWFVVGADGGVVVPAGASQLFLAVNDVVGQYHDNAGAFTLYVFVTDPHSLPTQLLTPANPVLGQPAGANPEGILPELDIDVFQAVATRPRPGQPASSNARLLLANSYVAYAVYATHTDKPPSPPPPPGPNRNCGSQGALGFAVFAGVGIVGVIIVRRPRRRRSDADRRSR